MKVFKGLKEYRKVKNPVVTIGTFDGVHLGHQQILKRLNDHAREIDGESLLLTFWPHPRLVLQPENSNLKLINTLDEKLQLLEKYGLNNVLVLQFTRSFSRLTPLEFIRDFLVDTIGTRVLVIGYDHRFGKNREGSFADLSEYSGVYDYALEKISPEEINEVTISSTKIREALSEGDIQQASEYMGHPFTLIGKVVPGDKLGRTLGFPTANISIEASVKLIPADGVYVTRVFLEGESYFGMLNIGNRPTVSPDGEKRIEVNIFNFSGDLYGKNIRVDFLEWIREDLTFSSLNALKNQLNLDREKSFEIIKRY